MLFVDYKTWLQDDILVKADRASMAHGLEVRSPFLDHQRVELCAGLPAERKLAGSQGKVILRDAARGLVPRFVLERKKSGFNAPVADWIDSSWRNVFDHVLGAEVAVWHDFLRREVVTGLLAEHRGGTRDHGHLLFSVFLLARWLERVRPRS
jgi:asparagine synthase (glutamine-hydrolysing)